ncbi:NAD(P)-binding domain-containing protein [Cupriavidus sp. amp6]|uniref:NAD(P)-binding domain-containing protein n=1 Tax=Cupriavidus sp. amp6 TaxID=388051 RepID=UPI0004099E22|nr:NAD(P)-binding domain-containing protein [Cupriavidus sp. amp6]
MTAVTTDKTIVGFVGLGQMGKPMALNLVHSDTELRVTSKVQDAYPELAAAGATTADDLTGLADAQIVFLSLPGTVAVLDVLFGEGELKSKLVYRRGI